MSQQDRTTLKGYFNKGDIPTEQNFADLVDSALNKEDDSAQILPAPSSGDAGKISRIKNDESGWEIFDPENERFRVGSSKAVNFEDETIAVFIDDDGHKNGYDVLRSIFNNQSVPCNIAVPVVTVWPEETSTPGFDTTDYLSESQLDELVNTDGWELVSHQLEFKNLVSGGLTDAEIIEQIKDSKKVFEDKGYSPKSFAYHQGDNDLFVRQQAQKYYRSGLSVAQSFAPNIFPLYTYDIRRYRFDAFPTGDGTTRASYDYFKNIVDENLEEPSLLIFMFHSGGSSSLEDAHEDKDGNLTDVYTIADQIIDYLKANNVDILTLNDALDRVENSVESGDQGGIFSESFAVGANGKQRFFRGTFRNFHFGKLSGKGAQGDRLTSFGNRSGFKNSGEFQTALGNQAGESNTGDSQTAVGQNAGFENTGIDSTQIGQIAGYKNVGRRQTAVGESAGRENTGEDQTAIGTDAGNSNTGINQTAVGDKAGQSNTGANHTAIGADTGLNNTGEEATQLGYRAGLNNTGDFQTAVGVFAGQNNNAERQTAVGYAAARDSTGIYLTAVGMLSADSNIGDRGVFLGYEAGRNNEGNNVVGVGYGALKGNLENGIYVVKHSSENGTPLIKGNFATRRLEMGSLKLDDLPTSDPAEAGVLWNDTGTLKVSAG